MKKAYHIKEDNKGQSDSIIQHEKHESVRLNKFISSSGFCSRREADRYIEQGLVKIDGEEAGLGTRVMDGQQVIVDGHEIETHKNFIYIVLHKPIGITCTTDTSIEGNIIDFMDYPATIFPIGRLDKESTGLILLTNDGDIVNKILRASNHHEKEYNVCVNKDITSEFMEGLRNGIQIYNPVTNAYQMTKPTKVVQHDDRRFTLILTEGLNRQIRRMCTAFDYQVNTLKRVRVMNICLGHLQVGQWRYVSVEELVELNKALLDTSK